MRMEMKTVVVSPEDQIFDSGTMYVRNLGMYVDAGCPIQVDAKGEPMERVIFLTPHEFTDLAERLGREDKQDGK